MTEPPTKISLHGGKTSIIVKDISTTVDTVVSSLPKDQPPPSWLSIWNTWKERGFTTSTTRPQLARVINGDSTLPPDSLFLSIKIICDAHFLLIKIADARFPEEC